MTILRQDYGITKNDNLPINRNITTSFFCYVHGCQERVYHRRTRGSRSFKKNDLYNTLTGIDISYASSQHF